MKTRLEKLGQKLVKWLNTEEGISYYGIVSLEMELYWIRKKKKDKTSKFIGLLQYAPNYVDHVFLFRMITHNTQKNYSELTLNAVLPKLNIIESL